MKIGIVAGSFDPITNGHIWLIKKAAALVDQLEVIVGNNTGKKYYFSEDQRLRMIYGVLLEENIDANVSSIHNDLLINHATSIGADFIFRGIRNIEDFGYESQIQQINRKINPDIETVFFICPPEISTVSSSMVKGLVGLNGWEKVVADYVHPIVLNALDEKNHTE